MWHFINKHDYYYYYYYYYYHYYYNFIIITIIIIMMMMITHINLCMPQTQIHTKLTEKGQIYYLSLLREKQTQNFNGGEGDKVKHFFFFFIKKKIQNASSIPVDLIHPLTQVAPAAERAAPSPGLQRAGPLGQPGLVPGL